MSFFQDLSTDATIANEKDSIGGGGVLESGLYPATVTLAYGIKSDGGARGLVFHAKTSEGRDIRQTIYMTSGTAKGGTNFYIDKKGEKQYLPGFISVNSLCLLTCGKDIADMDVETKVASIWNKETKSEVPTKVEMLVDLLGKEILIGLVKQTVDKTTKNDAGVYVPTGETREENEIDKFFRASDRKTTAEIRSQDEAKFADVWSNKNTGNTRDKTSKVGGSVGVPKAGFGGAPAANAAVMKKPAASLFA
jgi:hypothetical protein